MYASVDAYLDFLIFFYCLKNEAVDVLACISLCTGVSVSPGLITKRGITEMKVNEAGHSVP